MSGVSVRLATDGDLDFVERCVVQLMESCLNRKVKRIPGIDEIFRYHISDPTDHPVFIAELNGERVGMASCNVVSSLLSGGCAVNIADLVVDRSCRSGGVGTAIVDHIRRFAVDNAISSVELVTPDENSDRYEERIGFYKKMGFHEHGPTYLLSLDKDLLNFE